MGFAAMRDDLSYVWIPIRMPASSAAPNLQLKDDIRPPIKAIVSHAFEDGIELAHMRSSLVPFFHKSPLKAWKAATFSAKAETAKTLASFHEPFKRRRCLNRGGCWVEWKGEGTPKPRFFIEPPGR